MYSFFLFGFLLSLILLVTAEILALLFIELNKGKYLSKKELFISRAIFFLYYYFAGRNIANGNNHDIFVFFALFFWGYLFTYLDISNHWLPRRYTMLFLITGMIGNVVSHNFNYNIQLIISGSLCFLILLSIRQSIIQLSKKEAIGMGDVFIISGCFFWFSWQVAAFFSGLAFFFLSLISVLLNKNRLPYAPFLFFSIALVYLVKDRWLV
ncbi:hypothetical protein HGT70_14475 [Rosenbergiella collisarenosi]|uniref:prepilin peptidase n=1 Tax=Rosenbergiella collisarenosi TaxID=1544695 RepID=UPI001BD95D5D|nr:hypothetical protein [Rosenbergiella collisarenosi]